MVSKYKTSMKYFCRFPVRVGVDVEARRHHGTLGSFAKDQCLVRAHFATERVSRGGHMRCSFSSRSSALHGGQVEYSGRGRLPRGTLT